MKINKISFLLILSALFITASPELSAKSHHRGGHHKRVTRTSLAVNLNVDARTRAYERAVPVYYSAPTTTTTYYTTTYAPVVTQYQPLPTTYYEQVTVVRPAPVQQVIVQSEPRPSFSFSLSPFFSFWSR